MIRGEIERSSVYNSRESSVVYKYAEQGEGPTREGRKTTAAKFTEQWKMML